MIAVDPGAMSPIEIALQFAGRGWAVLPVGPDKRPWTPHGVKDASADPRVFVGFDWRRGSVCGVATGPASDIDVLDVDLRPSGDQENLSLRIDGFATLRELGLGDLPPTLSARTPSGGCHYWWRHIEGSRSRKLAPGVEWFAGGKFVIAPPAPGREWLTDLPIAEAPAALREKVLKAECNEERDFPGPQMAVLANSSTELPKGLYFAVLRLVPLDPASRKNQRRAMATLNALVRTREGRNSALNLAAFYFRQMVQEGWITRAAAVELLTMAAETNGYTGKDGIEATRATIRSGLGDGA